ncbi:MAG: D-sedoheptulose-7-phosphate isomerase [Planctomycetota bacterium]|jgi:D-sedoheptulose 7-phosphate isomerase
MTDGRTQLLAGRIDGSIRAIGTLRERLEQIDAVGRLVAGALDGGGLLATAGNGGSAAQALHLSEELVGRYRSSRPPLRAMCLNADPTALSCIANDFGFEQIFARQCEAFLGPGDVLLVLSTSGRSQNIRAALDAARLAGAATVALLGRDGGACRDRADHAIVVPEADSAHVQEAHQVIIHLLCEMLEPAAG